MPSFIKIKFNLLDRQDIDFGGEVERSLLMVDSVILCDAEGSSQTSCSHKSNGARL